MIDYQRLKNDLLALGCLALSVFLALSLGSYDPADPPASLVFPAHTSVANLAGQPGAFVANGLFAILGEAAWFLLLLLVMADFRLFRRVPTPDPGVRVIGGVLLIAACALALQLLIPTWGHGPVIGSGGWMGAWSSAVVERHFSMTGGMIVVGTLSLAGLLLAVDDVISQWCVFGLALPVRVVLWPLRAWTRRYDDSVVAASPPIAVTPAPRAIPVHAPPMPAPPPTLIERVAALVSSPLPPPPEFKVNLPLGGRTKANRPATTLASNAPRPAHRLPDSSLLENAQEFPFEKLAAKAQQNAAT